MEQTNAAESAASETSDNGKDLANVINAAVSAQLKRHMAKIPEMMETLWAAKQAPAQTSAPQEGSTATTEDKSTRQELDDLKRQLKAEKQRAKEGQALSDVRGKLAPHVLPEALDLALKVIQADRRVVVKGDSVKWVSDGVEVDLDEGVSEWVNSKEAAYFLPAKRPTAQKSVNVKAPNRPTQGGVRDPRAATLAAFEKLGLRL